MWSNFRKSIIRFTFGDKNAYFVSILCETDCRSTKLQSLPLSLFNLSSEKCFGLYQMNNEVLGDCLLALSPQVPLKLGRLLFVVAL